jgi:hypothetical protein
MSEYLNKVLIHLKQELPTVYRDSIVTTNNRIEIIIPGDFNFNLVYDELFKFIESSIKRVIIRQADFEFNIKSKYQERSFKIRK